MFVVVFFVILVLFLSFKELNDFTQDEFLAEEQEAKTETKENGFLALDEKTISEQDSELMYALDVRLPYFKNNDFFAINKDIENFIFSAIDVFRENLKGQIFFESLEPIYNELKIDYSVARIDENVFSVQFMVFSAYSGAAHPISNISTLNYALQEKKPLNITDCFNDLLPISDYVKTELLSQLNSGFWPEGVSPEQGNYKNFLIKNNSFEIIFNPYQVAPYSRGIIKIEIPFSDFKDKIVCDFVLN